MKKVLLLTSSFILVIIAHAQVFQNGDKLFGGSFSFSVFNINQQAPGYYNSGNAGILPAISFGIKNNLALGIRGNFTYNRVVNSGAQRNTQTVVSSGLSVFLRKYKPLQNRFGIYFDNSVGGSLSFTKTETKDGILVTESKSKYSGINYSFTPGVFYKFSEKFLGEANIGGASIAYSKQNNSTSSTFSAGASFLQYFNVGFNYLISKRQKG